MRDTLAQIALARLAYFDERRVCRSECRPRLVGAASASCDGVALIHRRVNQSTNSSW